MLTRLNTNGSIGDLTKVPCKTIRESLVYFRFLRGLGACLFLCINICCFCFTMLSPTQFCEAGWSTEPEHVIVLFPSTDSFQLFRKAAISLYMHLEYFCLYNTSSLCNRFQLTSHSSPIWHWRPGLALRGLSTEIASVNPQIVILGYLFRIFLKSWTWIKKYELPANDVSTEQHPTITGIERVKV